MADHETFLQQLEAELAGESSLEGVFETAHESDQEAEEFFGSLAGLAKRAIASPALRKIASGAARAALRGGVSTLTGMLGEAEDELAHEFSHEFSHELAHESAHELWGEEEDELSHELSHELAHEGSHEAEVEAIMEHLGHAAAQAETEEEAFAFLAPLLPLAAKALAPMAAKALPKIGGMIMKKAAPQLMRGVQGIARNLFSNRKTRPLLRSIPSIVQETTRNLARQAAAGRPVTPQAAAQTLARTAAQTLSSPQKLVRVYRRSKVADRRVHSGIASAPAPQMCPTCGN